MSILLNPDKVRKADIVIGIPSYNEADAISYPTKIASEGLKQYFSQKSSVIVNVDNASTDNTKDAFLNTKTDTPKIYVSTAQGVKGKGRNFRNFLALPLSCRPKQWSLLMQTSRA